MIYLAMSFLLLEAIFCFWMGYKKHKESRDLIARIKARGHRTIVLTSGSKEKE